LKQLNWAMPTTLFESESESAPVHLAELLGRTDSSIDQMIEHGDLWQALQALEPRERAIIYYRFFLNLPQTEVAERLGISQMHVSRLQQKALHRLRELVSEQ
jgi:RNA polymerase sigma-B factor